MELLNLLQIFNKKILLFLNRAVIALFSLLIVLISINVIFRYIFKSPIFWVTEFSCYCLVWLVFIGSSIAFYNGEHICMNFSTDSWPTKLKFILYLIHSIFIFLFLIIIIVYGTKLSLMNINSQTSTLPVSKGLVYFMAPINGFFMFLFFLEIVLVKWRKYN